MHCRVSLATKGKHRDEHSRLPNSNLAQAIDDFDPATLVAFPAFDGSKFSRLLDDEMGYTS